jgi:NAD(P)-dependent dehydrogenase (short-subunit alcohol dehydrogenase family)
MVARSMGKYWTLRDMPNQSGRRVVVTGANSGIGYHAALELARNGAHIVLACRNPARCEDAVARLQREVPNARTEVAILDLAELDSVREFAAGEVSRGVPLDLLINNAGVMAPKRRLETKDGLELQFGTNVLGHFVLTALLLPALIRSAAMKGERPRVVTIASIAHKRGRLRFDDLQCVQSYNPMSAYQQSKLANLMLALELDRRLRAAGEPASRIMSVAAHPGVADTNLFQVGEFGLAEKIARRGLGVVIKELLNSDDEGALATLYAATAPDVQDGGYYGPKGFREMRGVRIGDAEIAPQAVDRTAAEQLWDECERLGGLKLLD